MERCKVQRVQTENDMVSAVVTDQGSIACKFFVNCAGQVGAACVSVSRERDLVVAQFTCTKNTPLEEIKMSVTLML